MYNSTNKNLRFCLIGRGSIGTRHLENFIFLGFKNIVFYSTLKNKEKDEDYFNKYQIRTLHHLEELRQFKPDAFIIANPTSKHLEAANLALDMEAHIFMEKPLSNSLAGVMEFKERLNKTNKIFFQANCLRFHEAVIKIKKMIENGDFGKIYFARFYAGSYLPDWHPEEDYKSSYAAQRSLGGGVVLTLQHEIDYAYWFFGRFKRIKSFVSRRGDLKIDVEDTASIIVETHDSIHLEIHLDYLSHPAIRSIHIQGNLGSINYQFGDEFLEFTDFKNQKVKSVLDLRDYTNNQMYIEELKHFIRCIVGEDQSLVNIDDAIYTLEACLKIKELGS